MELKEKVSKCEESKISLTNEQNDIIFKLKEENDSNILNLAKLKEELE